MCNIRNVLLGFISTVLCMVLLYSINLDNRLSNSQVIVLEDIITNEKDLTVLYNLGLKGFVCHKDAKSDMVVCSKKSTSTSK